MSQDAPTPAGQGNLSSDLRGLAGRPRRYRLIEGFGLTLRLQSFNAQEFLAIREAPAALQTDMGISYAIVDENGDCTHTHDAEGVDYLKGLDAEVYLWLVNEVNSHCLGEKKRLTDERKYAIRLARECGRADVDQFLSELTPQEFLTQIEYDEWLSSVNSR